MEWISVEDKLPKKVGEYLWCRQTGLGKQIFIAPFTDKHKYPLSSWWMPLPDPPEEELL